MTKKFLCAIAASFAFSALPAFAQNLSDYENAANLTTTWTCADGKVTVKKYTHSDKLSVLYTFDSNTEGKYALLYGNGNDVKDTYYMQSDKSTKEETVPFPKWHEVMKDKSPTIARAWSEGPHNCVETQ